eukprot:1309171-Pleurochrysis_carterae.AAC.4
MSNAIQKRNNNGHTAQPDTTPQRTDRTVAVSTGGIAVSGAAVVERLSQLESRRAEKWLDDDVDNFLSWALCCCASTVFAPACPPRPATLPPRTPWRWSLHCAPYRHVAGISSGAVAGSGAATRCPRDATHCTVLHRTATQALVAPAPREMAAPSTDPSENLVTPGVVAEESREARLRRDATDAKLHMTERECRQSLQALFTQLGLSDYYKVMCQFVTEE